MKKRERIRALDVSHDEINELEAELIQNIERMDADPKDLKRLARMVGNGLHEWHQALHAQDYLEDIGVEIIRRNK